MKDIEICKIINKQNETMKYGDKRNLTELCRMVAQAAEKQCQQERAEIYRLVSSHVAKFALRYCYDLKGDFAREVQKLLNDFDSESLKKQILSDAPLTALSQQEREKWVQELEAKEWPACYDCEVPYCADAIFKKDCVFWQSLKAKILSGKLPPQSPTEKIAAIEEMLHLKSSNVEIVIVHEKDGKYKTENISLREYLERK
jgi:hypothetical protein